MNNKVVILGTAHRKRTPGKCSPDYSFKEYKYSREIISEIKPVLVDYGYQVFVDLEADDLPRNMQTPNVKLETQRELGLRVNYVNEICREHGRDNCIYVSIHNNACGSDGLWHDAHGWSVYVSPHASERSKVLADYLFDAAKSHGLKMRQPEVNQKYWEQSLYVLNHTICPAVLTENLFQDNKQDVKYLLSDEGRHVISRLHLEGIMRYFDDKQ